MQCLKDFDSRFVSSQNLPVTARYDLKGAKLIEATADHILMVTKEADPINGKMQHTLDVFKTAYRGIFAPYPRYADGRVYDLVEIPFSCSFIIHSIPILHFLLVFTPRSWDICHIEGELINIEQVGVRVPAVKNNKVKEVDRAKAFILDTLQTSYDCGRTVGIPGTQVRLLLHSYARSTRR